MKSVMLHVSDDPGFEARYETALDLAREFGGHLTCMQPVAYDVMFAGDFYGVSAGFVLDTARELAESHRKKIEQDLAREDVAWDWISELGGDAGRLLENAALHDVCVFSAPRATTDEGKAISLVGNIALHSRAPVLVVPQGSAGFDVDTPALVAWNSSVEAGNALRAAIPMLQRAPQVFLACVNEPTQGFDSGERAKEAAAYLSRHGVASEIVTMPVDSKGVAHTLLAAAQARDAGYVVLGAYGHSRLREAIFGGVTRDMLMSADIPLLLAH